MFDGISDLGSPVSPGYVARYEREKRMQAVIDMASAKKAPPTGTAGF